MIREFLVDHDVAIVCVFLAVLAWVMLVGGVCAALADSREFRDAEDARAER